MAEFRDMLASVESRNWMTCSLAQNLVKPVLDKIVATEIALLQTHLLQTAWAKSGLQPNTICGICLLQNLLPCPTRKLCKGPKTACLFHNDVTLKPRKCPANGLCNAIRSGIKDHHRFGGPTWKNTDSKRWCYDSWAIAKFYMPPDGYTNANNVLETDMNGILNILINCRDFQNKFAEDLSKPEHFCAKARENGRLWRHSPLLKMSDDDMHHFIDTLVGILDDPTFFRKHRSSLEIRSKLGKLKTRTQTIAATDINMTLNDAVQSMKYTAARIKTEINASNVDRESLVQYHDLTKDLKSICQDVQMEIEGALRSSRSLSTSRSLSLSHVKNCSLDYTPLDNLPSWRIAYQPVSCTIQCVFAILCIALSIVMSIVIFKEHASTLIFLCVFLFVMYKLYEESFLPNVKNEDLQNIIQIQRDIEKIQRDFLNMLKTNNIK